MKKLLLSIIALMACGVTTFAATVGDTYEKVTSADGLTVGDEYILCYEKIAMGDYASSKKYMTHVIDGITLDAEGTTATIADAAVKQFRIVSGTANNTYAITFGDTDFLGCAKIDNGQLISPTELGTNNNMTITFDPITGDVYINPTANSNSGKNLIQYNSGSPRFTNYKTGAQNAVQLYKKVEDVSGLEKPTFEFVEASAKVEIKTDNYMLPAINTNSTGAITYSSSNPEVATVEENGHILLISTGTTVITATVAETDVYKSATATFELTVYDENVKTVVETLTVASFGNPSSYSNKTFTSAVTGIVYKANLTTNSGNIQIRSTSNSGIVATENKNGYVAKKVTIAFANNTADARKVDIYGSEKAYTGDNAANLYNDNDKGTLLGTIAKSTPVALDLPSNTLPFIGLRSNDGALYISSITIEYEPMEAKAVENPVINCNDNMVSISCATEGASIHYTLDGTEPTAESSVYTEPFAINSTVTVKAVAVKDGELSYVAQAECKYVKTSYSGFAELFAEKASGKIDGPLTAYAYTGKYLFMQDALGTRALLYGQDNLDVANGDRFASVTGEWGEYGSNSQLNNFTLGEKTTGEPVAAVERTLAELTEADYLALVTIKNVTLSEIDAKRNFTITEGETTLAGYNQFGTTYPEDVTTEFDITGIYTTYNGKVQLQPLTFTAHEAAPKPVEAFTCSHEIVDEIIEVSAGEKVSFTARNATEIIAEISVDGAESVMAEVEGETFEYVMPADAKDVIIELLASDELGNSVEATYMLSRKAAPALGEILFTPASGEIVKGSTVTVTCENAVKIEYMIGDDVVTAEGDKVSFEVNEDCEVYVIAYNADNESADATATYTVVDAPATGVSAFDFTVENAHGLTTTSNSQEYETKKNITDEANHVHIDMNGVEGFRHWKKSSSYELRVYKTGSLTVSVPAGHKITSISFTGTAGDNFKESHGTLENKVWTPDEGKAYNYVTFTATHTSGNKALTAINVEWCEANIAGMPELITVTNHDGSTLDHNSTVNVEFGTENWPQLTLSHSDKTVEIFYSFEPATQALTPAVKRAIDATETANQTIEHFRGHDFKKANDELVISTAGTLHYFARTNGVATPINNVTFTTTTGIEDVAVDGEGDDDAPVYNIYGQRVGENYRGIVIKNGRKFVRK